MKVVLFDAILEMHVVRSLARALRGRGHEVLTTGQLTHTHRPISSRVDISRVNEAIDATLAFRPELIVSFRPPGLTFPLLRRLRKSGALIFAWFSDDPVLWGTSYGSVVDHYDTILHCGNRRVLDFYEKKHGFVTGVNFPFWTDSTEYPYVYGSQESESDVLFLGNTGDRVRRERYFELGNSGLNVRIYGHTGDDYLAIGGGYLDSREEVLDAGDRYRVAVNIPQSFRDHRDTPTWFEGLSEIGHFDVPSRVVQYAAMGLPIVSLLPPGGETTCFPEITTAYSLEESRRTIAAMLSDDTLEDLSLRTNARFQEIYSAGSRVEALEALVRNDDWRRLDSLERAQWFADFRQPVVDVAAIEEPPEPRAQPITASDPPAQVHPTISGQRVAVIGDGRGDYFSPLRTTTRSLAQLGFSVHDVVPKDVETFLREDPIGGFSGLVDLNELYDFLDGSVDVFLFVGSRYRPCARSRRLLALRADVRVVVHALEVTRYSEEVAALTSLADLTSFLHEDGRAAFAWESTGVTTTDPMLVDGEYARFVGDVQSAHPVAERVMVLAERRGDLERYSELLAGLGPLPLVSFIASEETSRPHGLARLARALHSAVVVVLDDQGYGGSPANRLLGHALLSAGLVVVPRGASSAWARHWPQPWVVAASGPELSMKLKRLAAQPRRVSAIRANAYALYLRYFTAESALTRLLAPAVPRAAHFHDR